MFHVKQLRIIRLIKPVCNAFMQKNLIALILIRSHSSAGWNLGQQQVSDGLIEQKT